MHHCLFESQVPQSSVATLEGGNVHWNGLIGCGSCPAWIEDVRYTADELSDWPLLGSTPGGFLYSRGLHLCCV